MNDGEDVVEIVRDSAGELADGLHFLRLAQLLFQSPLRCDVPKQAEEQQRLPVQFNERIGDFQGHHLAVVKVELALNFTVHVAGAETFPMPFQHGLRLFGFGIDNGKRFIFHLFRLPAEQFAVGLVDGNHNPVFIRQTHSIHGVFPNGTEKHLGTLHRRFGGAPLGDVAHMQQQGGFAVIFHAAGAHFDGGDAAVGGQAFPLNPGQLAARQFGKIAVGASPGATAERDRSGRFCQLIVRASGRAARRRQN